jgi:hypothetical protein
MKLLPILFFCALPVCLIGQTNAAEEQAVAEVITTLFRGMLAGDSAAVAPLFHPAARLQSARYNAVGESLLEDGDLSAWMHSIATNPAGTLDERLTSMKIAIDVPLATVWTDYRFFFQGAFHHCGTNAFQLVKTEAGWRIHQVTDTRRQDNCPPSKPEVVHAFLNDWHHAAAVADADAFYGAMAADAIYLGTDASERWLRDELRTWAQFAFDRASAWAFTPYDRHLYFSQDENYVWWEEKLTTQMGPCRGSGVAHFADGHWRIKHFNLALLVPNDKMDSVKALIGGE